MAKPEPTLILLNYNNSLYPVAERRIYPFWSLTTSAISKQSAFKKFIGRCSKYLLKIHYEFDCLNLAPLSKFLVKSFITVVSWVSLLWLFLNACCLSNRKSMFIKMSRDVRTHYILQQHARYTSQRGGSVIAYTRCVTFLIKETYILARDFTRVNGLLDEIGKYWA